MGFGTDRPYIALFLDRTFLPGLPETLNRNLIFDMVHQMIEFISEMVHEGVHFPVLFDASPRRVAGGADFPGKGLYRAGQYQNPLGGS